jgi:hypothetical protein
MAARNMRVISATAITGPVKERQPKVSAEGLPRRTLQDSLRVAQILRDTYDPYTIMDRIDAARAELREHLAAVTEGTENSDDDPINLFLPHLSVTIPR